MQCAWEENALSFHTVSAPLKGMDEAVVASKENGWICIPCIPFKVTLLDRKSASRKGLGHRKDTQVTLYEEAIIGNVCWVEKILKITMHRVCRGPPHKKGPVAEKTTSSPMGRRVSPQH